MTSKEREVKILEIVRENKIVSFKHLLKELDIPSTTLRRDLTRLDEEKKLVRFHGGAKAIEDINLDYYESQNYPDFDIKHSIAKKAVSLLNDEDIIFLDSGTTAYTMAKLIDNKTITIYTTSVIAAMDLSKRGMKVFLIGGFIQNNISAIFGNDALALIAKKHFDKSFLASTALNEEEGFLTVYEEDAKIKSAVINKSGQSYIMASSKKFDEKAHITFANNKDAILITDKMPDIYRNSFSYIESH